MSSLANQRTPSLSCRALLLACQGNSSSEVTELRMGVSSTRPSLKMTTTTSAPSPSVPSRRRNCASSPGSRRLPTPFLFSLLVAILTAGGHAADPNPERISEVTVILQAAILSMEKEHPRNALFSPFTVLKSLIALRDASSGAAREELNGLLGNPGRLLRLFHLDSCDAWPHVCEANGIFLTDSVGDDEAAHYFRRRCWTELGVDVRFLDFENSPQTALSIINQFVWRWTGGEFHHLLTSADISEQTEIAVVNGLYFNAPWESPFHTERLRQHFRPLSGRNSWAPPQLVTFMQQIVPDAHFPYLLTSEMRALRLPYSRSNLFLYIFMPRNFFKFHEELVQSPGVLESLVDQMLQAHRQRRSGTGNHPPVNLRYFLPEFLLSEGAQVDVRAALQYLGITTLFSESHGNKRLLANLRVSSFKHAAQVSVGLLGTLSRTGRLRRSLPIIPLRRSRLLTLIFDGPFIFQIRYHPEFLPGQQEHTVALPDIPRNGITLLSGHVLDALAAQQRFR
ncbi:serpin (serine proteinase inhibitor) superfamily protein [Cystoisospora suis]|uniref:Serpin (Serine proteinase inhibitor) superfamily protein n=1 Tax=Cystoisospora suis TaxID=483139 RepID=A0A2C6KTQ6_9APIC|nr:serpin (serine proteinase inhibitor) superfamily protein [Cystoisospora suis]